MGAHQPNLNVGMFPARGGAAGLVQGHGWLFNIVNVLVVVDENRMTGWTGKEKVMEAVL